MSEEQLKAFMEAVKADAGLQEKLNAAADADAVVAIAKAAGFVISAEELQRSQAGTISEEDLEGVVGGRPRDETHCTCNEPTTFLRHRSTSLPSLRLQNLATESPPGCREKRP